MAFENYDYTTGSTEGICGRCGKPFTPEFVEIPNRLSSMCDTCKVRNIFDGLGMMTPPELLDEHTTLPALTQDEFKRSLED
jgi:hypothetical protein